MNSACALVTRENLETLEAFGRDTPPPPPSQQAASDAAVEKCRVRNLMAVLQRHSEGRQYLQELGIEEVGLDGVLYGSLEPSITDLGNLKQKMRAKVDMLGLQDPPAKTLEEAKNSVLNVMLELLYGGPSYHLILVREEDVVIEDYADAKIQFKGSEKDRESPTWWESKHAALATQRDKADRNPNVPIPQELAEAVNDVAERLDGVRKLYRKLVNGDRHADRWVQSMQGDLLDKRKRKFDEDTVPTSHAKRRRLSGEAATTGAKQPAAAIATLSVSNTTAAQKSRRSTSQVAATSDPVRPTAIDTLRRSGGNQGAPSTQQRRQTRKTSHAGAFRERQQARQKSRVEPAVTRSGIQKPSAGSMSGGRLTTRIGRESRMPLRYPYTELRKADGSVIQGRFNSSSGIALPVGT